ncbi:hypothetical protein B0A48_13785 [Cryoendolithus antarcticus]|uniref:BTB domain-containing protein n=1 Tax=Cryoendolithus antarcticus TaxID=1507870 RepID=A0A1V8SMP0_9PEZI|nr:hypothetical protein B0A48_13785 [Cryoendolithus antarcticus]
MLETGDFSDFSIVCGEREWKVHKAIISHQSEYFKAACSGGFDEASSKQIDLSCDDVTALETLISFMYTGALPKVEADCWAVPDALLALRVHVLADKYGMATLGDLAAEDVMRIASGWCFDAPFGSWLIAVQEETAEHSVLRKFILDLVRGDLECLLNSVQGKYRKAVAAFKDALTRYPEFTVLLLAQVAEPDIAGSAHHKAYRLAVKSRMRIREEKHAEFQARCHCRTEFTLPSDFTDPAVQCPGCNETTVLQAMSLLAMQ